MTREAYERRARELLLQPGAAERFVALNVWADGRGECPRCQQPVGRFEHERMTHVRICKE